MLHFDLSGGKPITKMGMNEFGILPSMTGSKMLFAGIRFFVSGLIILATAQGSHRKFGFKKGMDAWFILLYALLNTTLHYAFFYFGLSHNAGARSAIFNSLIPVVGAITSCLCLGEPFYCKYLIAGALATSGIYIINKGKK